MDIEEFRAIRYFHENYSNNDMYMDFDLNERIEFFYMYEGREIVEALRKEIEALYMYYSNDIMSIKQVADILGIRISTKRVSDRAMDEIQLFFQCAEKRKFRTIWYFLNCYLGCYIDWYDLKNCIEDILVRENIEVLKTQIEVRYILNDPELTKSVALIESRIERFYMEENEEKVKAFKKEIETMYILIDNPALMKDVAYRLGGDIRMPVKKAVSVIKLIYDKASKR